MSDSIRTDPSAYAILLKYRKVLREDHKQTGASFNDAIRYMENLIQQGSLKPPTWQEDESL
jgi:hypothetical protein